MEPEGFLPYSQVPANCPYAEPIPSSPHHPLQLPEDPFYIILPSTSGSPRWLLSLRFPHQHPVHYLPDCNIGYIILAFAHSKYMFTDMKAELKAPSSPSKKAYYFPDYILMR
jgi:hypothetical protein